MLVYEREWISVRKRINVSVWKKMNKCKKVNEC